MSTCVKIIFHEENDGVDVRVGYDETPDATETELNYATVFAKQIGEIVRNMSCAQDLTQKWRRDAGNAAALRAALEEQLRYWDTHVRTRDEEAMRQHIEAALAKPARNCDRFNSGEEAWIAFERERPDWCDEHSSKDPDCDDCEMADCGRCMAEWLFATEGGAE